MDFPQNHAFSRSQHHVTREREREAGGRAREGAVYIVSRPQIYSHPAAPRRQQLPLFKGQFFRFVVICQFRLYAQSWFWRTGELTSPQRTPIRTQKRRKEKCPVHTLLLLVFPFLISRSGAGRQSHVQEEDSERQRQLQEPQGISEQREDGERFDRSCCSVLRAGLSQQTIHQQQRRVLWHRLQGEHKLSVGYSSYRDFTWEVKRISISQF